MAHACVSRCLLVAAQTSIGSRIVALQRLEVKMMYDVANTTVLYFSVPYFFLSLVNSDDSRDDGGGDENVATCACLANKMSAGNLRLRFVGPRDQMEALS